MYGYRRALMPNTRVYLPRRLARRFKDIHESEEQLRDILRRQDAGENILIRIAPGSRTTRRNATEPDILQVYSGNVDQLTPRFIVPDQATALIVRQRLIDLGVPVGADNRNTRTARIALEAMLELIELIPVRADDPGRWNPNAMTTIVESFRQQYDGAGPVYARGLQANPPPEGWVRGRLSGEEIRLIRAAANGVPALALMHSGPPDQPTGWYPTLVMPDGGAAYIFNPE